MSRIARLTAVQVAEAAAHAAQVAARAASTAFPARSDPDPVTVVLPTAARLAERHERYIAARERWGPYPDSDSAKSFEDQSMQWHIDNYDDPDVPAAPARSDEEALRDHAAWIYEHAGVNVHDIDLVAPGHDNGQGNDAPLPPAVADEAPLLPARVRRPASGAPLFLLSLFTCMSPTNTFHVLVDFGTLLPHAIRLSHTFMGYDFVFSSCDFSVHAAWILGFAATVPIDAVLALLSLSLLALLSAWLHLLLNYLCRCSLPCERIGCLRVAVFVALDSIQPLFHAVCALLCHQVLPDVASCPMLRLPGPR
jgi:hypothetical protein